MVNKCYPAKKGLLMNGRGVELEAGVTVATQARNGT